MNPDSTLLIFHAFQAVENRAFIVEFIFENNKEYNKQHQRFVKNLLKIIVENNEINYEWIQQKNPLETLYRCLLNSLLISLFSTMIFNKFFKTPSLSHFLLNKISLLNTFSATNLDTLVNKIMRSFKLSMVNNYSYSDKECCVAKYCIMYIYWCSLTGIYTLKCKTNSKFEARINLYQNNWTQNVNSKSLDDSMGRKSICLDYIVGYLPMICSSCVLMRRRVPWLQSRQYVMFLYVFF